MKRKWLIAVLVVLILGGLYLFHRYSLVRTRRQADIALFLTGDYQKAITDYTTLIEESPNTPGLYLNRGDAYSNANQPEQAIADYRKALSLGSSDRLQTTLRIGLRQKDQGKWQEARATFIQLLDSCSEKDTIELNASYYHLGQIAYKLGSFRQAVDYYNRAIRICDYLSNRYHRANAYHALGLLDSARVDFIGSIGFVKRDYVIDHPDSYLAKCDTCGFPFGSKEYDLLTQSSHPTVIQSLERIGTGQEAEDLKRKLESAAH